MSEINKCPALSANALLCNCSLEAGHARSHVCRGTRQHTKHVFFKTRAIEVPPGFGNDDISRELERQARLVAVEPQYLAELERHQAEDRAAIRALENAGRVLSERLDEFEAALIGQRAGRVDADPDIFSFQETPESWQKMHALDSAQQDLDTAIQEHAAAIQRAREK